MSVRISRTVLNLAGAIICAGMMGFAFFSQLHWGLEPCNMCILQRLCVSTLGALFVLAAVIRVPRLWNGVWLLGLAVAGAATMAVSLRQVWMQAQPAGSLPSCGADFFTLVDMLSLPQAVMLVWNGGGECQAINWSLLGLSMAGWVFLAALALTVLAIIANWPRRLMGLDP